MSSASAVGAAEACVQRGLDLLSSQDGAVRGGSLMFLDCVDGRGEVLLLGGAGVRWPEMVDRPSSIAPYGCVSVQSCDH